MCQCWLLCASNGRSSDLKLKPTLGEPVVRLVVWCNSESSDFFLVTSKCYKFTVTTLSQGLRVEILHFLVRNSQ
jgi:hypothetical protein